MGRRMMRSEQVVRQVRGKVFLSRLGRRRSTARRVLGRRVRGRLARIPVIRRRDKLLTIIKISFFFFFVDLGIGSWSAAWASRVDVVEFLFVFHP